MFSTIRQFTRISTYYTMKCDTLEVTSSLCTEGNNYCLSASK